MKDVLQISFSVKVEASPLAKGLTDPFVKLLEKSVPLIERVANAAVASFEKETKEETKEDKPCHRIDRNDNEKNKGERK